MAAYRLTNAQWKHIRPLVARPKSRGRPPADNRQTLEAILHVLTAGCRWSDLPRSLGNHVTAWRRLRKWAADGTLAQIWPYLWVEFGHAEKINLSRHKLEGLQIPSDSPQILIRRSGEREERKRARLSGRRRAEPDVPGKAHGQLRGEDQA